MGGHGREETLYRIMQFLIYGLRFGVAGVKFKRGRCATFFGTFVKARDCPVTVGMWPNEVSL